MTQFLIFFVKGPSPPIPHRRPPEPAVESNKPATPTRLSRGRSGRGILVKSMTFTAKDVDPTSRYQMSGERSNRMTRNEEKRCEAVWDLFQSETAFLLDHLMVMKHVC